MWSRRPGILCFKARNKLEEKPAPGAPATGAPREKTKKTLNIKDTTKLGDCKHWMTEGQCAKGGFLQFEAGPSRKKNGKGRGRPSSPTRTPRNDSKGDGTGKAGTSPPGKNQTALRVSKFQKGEMPETIVLRSLASTCVCAFQHSSRLYDPMETSVSPCNHKNGDDKKKIISTDMSQNQRNPNEAMCSIRNCELLDAAP